MFLSDYLDELKPPLNMHKTFVISELREMNKCIIVFKLYLERWKPMLNTVDSTQ